MTLPSHATSKNAVHVKYLVGGVTLPSHVNAVHIKYLVGG